MSDFKQYLENQFKNYHDNVVVPLAEGGLGTPGADGKSAYEIAVENGFEGTEAEWLESLNADIEGEITNVDGIEKDYTYEEVTYDETVTGKYISYGGNEAEMSSTYYVSKNVNEGEEYAVTSRANGSLINYVIFDDNGNVVAKYPDVNHSLSEASSVYRKRITIPSNGAVLKVSSYAGYDAKIENIIENIKVDTVENDVKEIIGAFSNVDGIETRETPTFIPVDNAEIINNAYIGKSNTSNDITKITRGADARVMQVSVNSGEVYKIHGSSRYLTALYAVYDAEGNILMSYPSPSDSGERRDETFILTMPENAKYLRVGAYPASAEISILKKVLNTSLYIPNTENNSYGNVLFQKKWCACGDSFTEGDFTGFVDSNGLSGSNSPVLYDAETGHYKTYPYWIGTRNKMTLQWLAVCGSDFTNCENAVNPFSDTNSPTNYSQIDADCDYVTLMYGLNEINLTDAQIGTKGDTTNETLWGAYDVVIKSILTANPFCKIGIIIADASMSQKYHDAIIDIAKYYGIPYLDLKNGENVPMGIGGRFSDTNTAVKNLRNNAFRISESNGHPTVEAHKYRSTIIENFLRSL